MHLRLVESTPSPVLWAETLEGDEIATWPNDDHGAFLDSLKAEGYDPFHVTIRDKNFFYF